MSKFTYRFQFLHIPTDTLTTIDANTRQEAQEELAKRDSEVAKRGIKTLYSYLGCNSLNTHQG